MLEYITERVDIKIFIIVWLSCTILLLSIIHYYNTGETDYIYEEAAEDVIEHFSGVKVDFSFYSDEP